MIIYQVEVIAHINNQVIVTSDLFTKRESAEKAKLDLIDEFFDPKNPDVSIVLKEIKVVET